MQASARTTWRSPVGSVYVGQSQCVTVTINILENLHRRSISKTAWFLTQTLFGILQQICLWKCFCCIEKCKLNLILITRWRMTCLVVSNFWNTCWYFRISSENGFHSVFTTNYDKLNSGKSRTKGLVDVIMAVEILIFKWYWIYVWLNKMHQIT